MLYNLRVITYGRNKVVALFRKVTSAINLKEAFGSDNLKPFHNADVYCRPLLLKQVIKRYDYSGYIHLGFGHHSGRIAPELGRSLIGQQKIIGIQAKSKSMNFA
jgi:hypothetical protein